MNLKNKLNNINLDLTKIVIEAGKLLPKTITNNVKIFEKDGKENIVTNYDLEVQNFIIEKIKSVDLNALFLTEENYFTGLKENKPIYYIDPIDGTTNFVNNINFSSISIAKVLNNEVVESVVYNPYLEDIYYAKINHGAYLNGSKIEIEETSLSESLVGYSNSPYDKYLKKFSFDFGYLLYQHCLDFRRMGSSALEICFSGANKYQAFCELILYPWDFAAASLFVKEAGGIITDLNGNKLSLEKRSGVISGNKKAHNEIIKLFQNFKSNYNEKIIINEKLYDNESF